MKIRQLLESKSDLLELQQALIDALDDHGLSDYDVKVDSECVWLQKGPDGPRIFENTFAEDSCNTEDELRTYIIDMLADNHINGHVEILTMDGPSGGHPEIRVEFPSSREVFRFAVVYTGIQAYKLSEFMIPEILELYELDSIKAK